MKSTSRSNFSSNLVACEKTPFYACKYSEANSHKPPPPYCVKEKKKKGKYVLLKTIRSNQPGTKSLVEYAIAMLHTCNPVIPNEVYIMSLPMFVLTPGIGESV